MKRKIIYPLFGALIACSACTETIDVDLKEAAPQLVIEGKLSTTSAPSVQLSSTIAFKDDAYFPAIEGARITLSQGEDAPVQLTEKSPGNYTTDAFQGKIGETYTLQVTVEGKTYTAQETTPALVPLKQLRIVKTENDLFFEDDDELIYKLFITYDDPADTENFYQCIEYRNDVQVKTYVFSDETTDGRTVEKSLRFKDRELEKGDVVRLELQCITADVYAYLKDLTGVSGRNTSPYNPVSNIKGAELGYFSTFSSQAMEVVVEE